MTRFLLLLALLLPTLALTACTGGDDDDSAGDDDDTPYEQPAPWADMDFDQRKEYMEEVVLPDMAQRFFDHDPDTFADFSCETCHGYGAEANDYAMPSGIAPIPFPPDPNAEPRILAIREWMGDEMVPAMADLLETDPWTPATPDGLRCTDCHDQE
jgi:hypothetical protein